MDATLRTERDGAERRARRTAPLWRRRGLITSKLAAAAAGAGVDWRRAPLWTPVAFGAGIALYFAAPTEPSLWAAGGGVALAVLLLMAARRGGAVATLAAAATLLAALGLATGAVRARLVAAPVLDSPGEHRVEGRLLSVSRSGSGATRLLFDHVALQGTASSPARVRVTAPGVRAGDVRLGDRYAFEAYLGPPPGPTEPGGYDFRRRAWFERLGGVGRLEGPLRALGSAAPAGPVEEAGLWLLRLRADLAATLRARMPEAEGAFAAAILVGDRAAIPPGAMEDLRASNLAHLLAISGLHMALVTGLAFGAARLLTALAPPVALRFSGKKIAAVAALIAGAGYLALSGASVATQRAFVMVAVALVAVLLDRPAVTLRALALAALAVLTLQPESLVEPGFQMSFAATLALVAVYGETRDAWRRARGSAGTLGRVGMYLGALALTSLVAGAATAPFAAHHFNRVSSYGLIANVAAAPAMGLWVMPSAMLAGVLAPLGLEDWGLELMARGVGAILAVAHWVAGLPQSSRMTPEAPPGAMLGLVFGGLLLSLSRRAGKAVGAGLIGLSAVLWWADGRPDVLIAEKAALIGTMGTEGRALSTAGGRTNFAASSWLRRDGDEASPKQAAARPGLRSGRGWVRAELAHGWRLEALASRVDRGRLRRVCQERVILVAPRAVHAPVGPCVFVGREALKGAPLAIDISDGERAVISSAAERAGRRFWTGAGAQ